MEYLIMSSNNNNNNNQANFYSAITSPQAILGRFQNQDLDKQITQHSIAALSWIRLQEKFSLEPGLEQLECGRRALFQCLRVPSSGTCDGKPTLAEVSSRARTNQRPLCCRLVGRP